MKIFLIQIAVVTVAVLFCAYLLPGVHVDGFLGALFVALALALLNEFVRPLLVFFTIPATLFTFGLFLLVINAVIIMLADWIVESFKVDGFWWALLFSLLLTITKSFLNAFRPKKRREDEY